MATKSRLKAHLPELIKPRKPKILVYGASGVGKTWAALDFPAVYYLDAEGGATQPEYREKLAASGGLYLGPDDGAASFDEVMGQIRALSSERHDRKTLVIDSITKLFANEIAREAERLSDAGTKNEFGADRKPAVNYMRSMVSWLMKLDMNVILIAGEIAEWGKENGQRVQIGNTFDCWPRLEYELDAAFNVSREGASRVARVRKSRLAAFPFNSRFEWGYRGFADKYGADVIEADSVPLDLASDEQLAEVTKLLDLVRLPEGTVDKWLAAADVSAWAEMPAERVTKAITHLKTLMQGA